MRIGLDFRPSVAKNSRRRGIGKYTRKLVEGLLALNSGDEFFIYTCLNRVLESDRTHPLRNLPYLRRPSRMNWLLDRFTLPHQIGRDRLDIFHAMEITSIPKAPPIRIFVTVHDLIPFIFWEETVQRIPRDFAWALRCADRRIPHAHRILTDSRHSQRDICRRYGLDPGRVPVIYLGCDEEVGPREPGPALLRIEDRYGITSPFLFYVGGSDFRKNIPFLIRSFSAVSAEGYPGKLVLAGETFLWPTRETKEIHEMISRCGLETRVVFPGYIPDASLPDFYSTCDFFVFPSLYEGFGLPVLEALKCGARCLVSRSSSLPEVAGSAALYFDPESEQSFRDAFFSIYGDESRLLELAKRGPEQAGRFTWARTAREVLRAYQEDD